MTQNAKQSKVQAQAQAQAQAQETEQAQAQAQETATVETTETPTEGDAAQETPKVELTVEEKLAAKLKAAEDALKAAEALKGNGKRKSPTPSGEPKKSWIGVEITADLSHKIEASVEKLKLLGLTKSLAKDMVAEALLQTALNLDLGALYLAKLEAEEAKAQAVAA